VSVGLSVSAPFGGRAHWQENEKFAAVWHNDDVATYRLAQRVLKDEALWLEDGMVRDALPPAGAPPAASNRS